MLTNEIAHLTFRLYTGQMIWFLGLSFPKAHLAVVRISNKWWQIMNINW